MTHELFKLASATPKQLDLIMAGMVFIALVVAIGFAYSHWDHRRRRRSAASKFVNTEKARRRGQNSNATSRHGDGRFVTTTRRK